MSLISQEKQYEPVKFQEKKLFGFNFSVLRKVRELRREYAHSRKFILKRLRECRKRKSTSFDESCKRYAYKNIVATAMPITPEPIIQVSQEDEFFPEVPFLESRDQKYDILQFIFGKRDVPSKNRDRAIVGTKDYVDLSPFCDMDDAFEDFLKSSSVAPQQPRIDLWNGRDEVVETIDIDEHILIRKKLLESGDVEENPGPGRRTAAGRRRRNRNKDKGERGVRKFESSLITNPVPQDRLYNVRIIMLGLVQDAANGFGYVYIRPNNLNTPTGVVSAGTILTLSLGIPAASDEYNIGHMIGCMAELEIASNETGTPVWWYCYYSDEQPSVPLTSFNNTVIAGTGAQVKGHGVLGQTNSTPIKTIRTKYTPGTKIVGRGNVYKYNLEYDGTSTVSPNQALWFGFAVHTLAAGTHLAGGCTFKITLYMNFDFYSRKTII